MGLQRPWQVDELIYDALFVMHTVLIINPLNSPGTHTALSQRRDSKVSEDIKHILS